MLNQSKVNEKQKSFVMMDQALDPHSHLDLILQKKVGILMKLSQFEQQQLHQIVFKIYTSRKQEKAYLFLSSDSDLFFHYKCELVNKDAKQLGLQYKANINNLAQLILMIQKNIKEIEKGEKKGYIEIINQNSLKLLLYKDYNSKMFVVLQLIFFKENDDNTKILVAFKYGSLREEISQMEELIQSSKQKIKAKNPYLLTFINKI